MKNHILILLLLWLSKDFAWFSSALKFMNDLPASQREKAYIIVDANKLYTVIYPDS